MNAITMHITNNEAAHRFEADVNGSMAVADYMMDGDRLVLTHTEVPLDARGQGVAAQLARFAFDSARERGLKVVPRCAYMAAFAERHPEYQDIVWNET